MSDTESVNPQRGKAFWLDHVQRWQDSDLSKIAYCKQHNLNANSFYNWSRPVRMQLMAESDDKTSSELKPEEGQFIWPSFCEGDTLCVTLRELYALLDGSDISRLPTITPLHYQRV